MEKFELRSACLGRVKKLIDRFINERLRDCELSSVHAHYILAMQHSEKTKSLLTNELGFDKANTSRVVNDLIKLGYVDTFPTSKANVDCLVLSKKGDLMAEKINTIIDEFKKIVTKGVSQSEIVQFHSTASLIVNNAIRYFER